MSKQTKAYLVFGIVAACFVLVIVYLAASTP